MRKWTVKPEYRTKTDAKIAAVYLAGKDAIEFVRFRGGPAPADHDPFKPYKRAKEPQANGRAKKEESAPPARPTPVQAASTSAQPDGHPLLETKEEGLARQKVERDRKKHEDLERLRPKKRNYYTRQSPGPSYPPSPSSYGGQRNGRPYSFFDAAATAVINRVTSASSSPPAEYPVDNRASSSASHYAHSKHPWAPHDKPRDTFDRANDTTPPHPHYGGPYSPSGYPPSRPRHPPATPASVPPSPASHYPHPQESPSNVHYPYVGGAYPPNYGHPHSHPPFPFPMHPPTSFSPPPPSYAMTPPPSASPPAHLTMPPPPPTYPYPYAAYYADPRYGQYSMVPYAVALPPTAGYGYPSPASVGAPVMHGQWPVPSPMPAEAGPSDAHGRSSASVSNRDSVSMRRSMSVDVGERPKRPRSRQGTPEDAARLKKQRPESLPSPVSIKQESAGSRTPAPPSPISEPDTPDSVEQLRGQSGIRERVRH